MKRVLLGGLLVAAVLAVAATAQAAGAVSSPSCSPEPSLKAQTATCSASYSGINRSEERRVGKECRL